MNLIYFLLVTIVNGNISSAELFGNETDIGFKDTKSTYPLFNEMLLIEFKSNKLHISEFKRNHINRSFHSDVIEHDDLDHNELIQILCKHRMRYGCIVFYQNERVENQLGSQTETALYQQTWHFQSIIPSFKYGFVRYSEHNKSVNFQLEELLKYKFFNKFLYGSFNLYRINENGYLSKTIRINDGNFEVKMRKGSKHVLEHCYSTFLEYRKREILKDGKHESFLKLLNYALKKDNIEILFKYFNIIEFIVEISINTKLDLVLNVLKNHVDYEEFETEGEILDFMKSDSYVITVAQIFYSLFKLFSNDSNEIISSNEDQTEYNSVKECLSLEILRDIFGEIDRDFIDASSDYGVIKEIMRRFEFFNKSEKMNKSIFEIFRNLLNFLGLSELEVDGVFYFIFKKIANTSRDRILDKDDVSNIIEQIFKGHQSSILDYYEGIYYMSHMHILLRNIISLMGQN